MRVVFLAAVALLFGAATATSLFAQSTAPSVVAPKSYRAQQAPPAQSAMRTPLDDRVSVESLALLVQMQAAKDAKEDLRAMLESMNAARRLDAEQTTPFSAAQSQRLAQTPLRPPTTRNLRIAPQTAAAANPCHGHSRALLLGCVSKLHGNVTNMAPGPDRDAMEREVETLKGDLESMNEMGEMDSLRLQMAMDRMSKMMETLSNILKKMSETDESITQNLK